MGMRELQPVPFFDLTRQFSSIEPEVRASLDRVLESQTFILGPEVTSFEAALGDTLGVDRVVGVASGTDALLLPLKALEPAPDEEVIVPAFTFFATAGAVWNAGMRPVFCDVDPDTFNVTAETLGSAWSSRTRAVIPVHLFGQMARMPEIMAMARERDVVVVEDVAQALGASQDLGGDHGQVQAGAVGHAGSFSFFPTKNLGGFGDGGAVSARDARIGERVKQLRVHGGKRKYEHDYVGTNSRLDSIQAAVLSSKLHHLPRWIEARRRRAAVYDEAFGDIDGVVIPSVAEGNFHTYNQYTLKVERRDELRRHLADRGIGHGVYYPSPLHLQECFAPLGYRRGHFPVSEGLTSRVISLPIFPELDDPEVDRVVAAVLEFYT